MIKNILYSLFLHFLLLLLVYANFNLKNINSKRSNEISVSLISMSGNQEANQTKENQNTESEKTKEIPKEETAKEAESQKASSKNKVASLPKKVAKPRPAKSATKPVSETTQNAKEAEKPEDKPQESGKEKTDDVEQNQEDKKTKEPRKHQDVGADKISDQKIDSDSKQNVSNKAEAKQAQSLDNIDLSAREKFNIQSQLKRCYSRAVSETNYQNKTKFMVQVSINEDGVIDSDIDDLIDMERYNDPQESAYKIAVDNARRAIDLCSPIRNLPVEKYEIWKEVVLDFGDDS